MISSLGLTLSNNFDASLQRFSICLPLNDAYRTGPSAGAKTHTDHSIISDFIGYEITRTIWQFAGRGCNTCGFAVMQSRKRDHRRFDDCIQCKIAWPSIRNAYFNGKVLTWIMIENLTHETRHVFSCFRIIYNAMHRADKIKIYAKNISNN